MVIVPIVVSSKVCSLHTERARGRDDQGLFKSSTNSLQVRIVCLHPPRTDWFCSQSSEKRSVQGKEDERRAACPGKVTPSTPCRLSYLLLAALWVVE